VQVALVCLAHKLSTVHIKNKKTRYWGKSSESVQCAITGPCVRMRHRPSAEHTAPIRKICRYWYVTTSFHKTVKHSNKFINSGLHLEHN